MHWPARSPPSLNTYDEDMSSQKYSGRRAPHVLGMKENELDLALEAEPFDLRLRCRLEGLRQCVAKLLESIKVGRPVRICHQEQRRRVSRVVLEPLHFLPEPLETGLSIVGTRYLCGNRTVRPHAIE